MITNSKIFVQTKGSNPVVCAREGGANTTPFLAAAKKEAVKARAGKARQSKFAVRFFVKKSSDFVQQTPPY